MKKIFFILLLLSIGNVCAMQSIDEIRLYQPQDINFIRLVLINNQALMLPGSSLEQRLLKTVRYMNDSEHITKVCILNNLPIGFITYSRIDQFPSLANYLPVVASLGNTLRQRKVLHGFITYLFIDQEFRRCGVGEVLTNEAIKEMKSCGVKVIKCTIKMNHIDVRSLFEKLRFEKSVPSVVGPTECSYRLICE